VGVARRADESRCSRAVAELRYGVYASVLGFEFIFVYKKIQNSFFDNQQSKKYPDPFKI
jgi:hypothetical protein